MNMRTLGVVLAVLASVGCGSTNPDSWEKCDGPPCHVDPSSRWGVYADGGDVDERQWDVLGPPDPYICMSMGGSNKCSGSISDSSHPRWNDLLFSDVSASALFAGVSIGYWDKDTDTLLDTDDSICSGSLHITENDLAEGGVRFECERATATFTFHFVR